jgi:ribosomal protein S18 acetylase RimI-like enzyme
MGIRRRVLQTEEDFWRVRNFLRELFLLHDRHELSWHVARLDYWRWHFVENLGACPPLDRVMHLWEEPDRIVAVLHPFGMNEAFLAVHPEFRTPEFEHELIGLAEEEFVVADTRGERRLFITADAGDALRQRVLAGRGYVRRDRMIHRWWRDLDAPLAPAPAIPGYAIRSLGDRSELPARSWASWRAFHPNDPDDAYEGWKWYLNVQSAPLYRRDLDLVAATATGEIAAFTTIYFDDVTRSAVLVLVGTAPEHQGRGLGKAVIAKGLWRLQAMGATRVFATAYDPPADALYGSALGRRKLSHSWVKRF